MILRKLTILNYKNIREATLELSPKMNCFIGANGAGKTNVLEAIFLCALGRSHRTSRDAELIRMGEMEGMVLLNLVTRGGSRSIR